MLHRLQVYDRLKISEDEERRVREEMEQLVQENEATKLKLKAVSCYFKIANVHHCVYSNITSASFAQSQSHASLIAGLRAARKLGGSRATEARETQTHPCQRASESEDQS